MPGVATSDVTFTLTAATPGAAQGGKPAAVNAYLLDANGQPLSGHAQWCNVVSWVNGADQVSRPGGQPATAGTGTISCTISPETPIESIKSIEVEANQ